MPHVVASSVHGDYVNPGDVRVLAPGNDYVFLYPVEDYDDDAIRSTSPLLLIERLSSPEKRHEWSGVLGWWLVLSAHGLFLATEFSLRDWMVLL